MARTVETTFKVGDWVVIQYSTLCRHVGIGQIVSLNGSFAPFGWGSSVLVRFSDGSQLAVDPTKLVKASDLEVLTEWGRK